MRKFIVTENLYEEEAQEGHSHFEILVRMGMAVGLTRHDIEFAKPLPTTVVAMNAWEAMTKNRSWYEGWRPSQCSSEPTIRTAATFPIIRPITGPAS